MRALTKKIAEELMKTVLVRGRDHEISFAETHDILNLHACVHLTYVLCLSAPESSISWHAGLI